MEPTDLSIKKSSKNYSSRHMKKVAIRSKETPQNISKADLSKQCHAFVQDTALSQYSHQYSSIASIPRDVTNLQVRKII